MIGPAKRDAARPINTTRISMRSVPFMGALGIYLLGITGMSAWFRSWVSSPDRPLATADARPGPMSGREIDGRADWYWVVLEGAFEEKIVTMMSTGTSNGRESAVLSAQRERESI
jgi:hypothetical protein